MPLLKLEKACLAFGHHALLNGVDFHLDSGERVGLIGRNGRGKSSFLKVLAREIEVDDGNIWWAPGLKLSYVSQEPLLAAGNTVFQEISSGLGNLSQLLLEYHAVSHELSGECVNMQELLKRLHDLQGKLEALDGWNYQARVESVVDKLNLPADTLVRNLSGGLRKRVALARALVAAPNVLLLDEPTNHLDFISIEWFEDLFKKFSGSILFITHDRRFLDNVATRIVELDRGNLQTFQGDFAYYQCRKTELLEIEENHNHEFDKLLAREEIWIRKGIQARRTRNEGRVRQLKALRQERAERRNRVGKTNFNVDTGISSGKLVAEIRHVSKKFGSVTVVKDFSCRIMRGDRIGLLGPNGAGKSTLLKLILGSCQPDLGQVTLGTKLSIAYFDQMREQLDDEMTLVDTISQGSDFVEINGKKKHVVGYLEDFLFSPQRARSLVKSLSGGERNRLLLARLFTRPANVLVLDEPTNDLDIETLELLESLLRDYKGTIFLVSHDRAFLDSVVTQVIVFEGNGVLREFVGGYQDWVTSKYVAEPASQKKATSVTKPTNITKKPSKQESCVKLGYHEARELEALPEKIEALEKEQTNISLRLSDAVVYREHQDEVKILQERFLVIEKELTACFSRWEELESKSR